MIAFCITLLFSLIASVAIAQDLNLNTDTYKMNFERNQVENEKNCALKGVERAGFVDANPDLPYLLHQDQYRLYHLAKMLRQMRTIIRDI